MAYTEVKERNGNKYFYRVRTVRENGGFKKKRIYLGKDLGEMERIMKSDNANKTLNKEKIQSNIKKIKPAIVKVLKKYNIKRAGIFGSYSIGENTAKSDVDILVELSKPMGFGFVGMQQELEGELKRGVDLITYKSIHPLIKERILEQEIKII